jgi:nucleoside 2-deoxyribosyltransferase
MKYRVYLAGPDVFYPDAFERGDRLKALCRTYGFEGLFPLDNVIEECEAILMARAIREANLKLIDRADAVIANLEPFRGCEPDSGTVFEIGYAAALGKSVIGYADDLRTLKERLCEHQGLESAASHDAGGLLIEDFGWSHNLMFSELVRARSAEDALKLLHRERAASW